MAGRSAGEPDVPRDVRGAVPVRGLGAKKSVALRIRHGIEVAARAREGVLEIAERMRDERIASRRTEQHRATA